MRLPKNTDDGTSPPRVLRRAPAAPHSSLVMNALRVTPTPPAAAATPKGKGGPANGFVMKLRDMVHGAPDDVVSVSGRRARIVPW